MGRRSLSGGFITPVKNDGTVQTPSPSSGSGGTGWFLLAAGTYYFIIPEDDCESASAHVQWDSAIAVSALRVEDSNFPAPKLPNSADGTAPTDGTVANWSPNTGANQGEWVPETPTTAYVGTTVATNVTITNGSVAIAAGTQNAAMFHFADTGSKRMRIAIVVTTQGAVRCAFHGKD